MCAYISLQGYQRRFNSYVREFPVILLLLITTFHTRGMVGINIYIATPFLQVNGPSMVRQRGDTFGSKGPKSKKKETKLLKG